MTSNGEKQSATTCINPRISLAFARDTFDKLSISAYGLDVRTSASILAGAQCFSLPEQARAAKLVAWAKLRSSEGFRERKRARASPSHCYSERNSKVGAY